MQGRQLELEFGRAPEGPRPIVDPPRVEPARTNNPPPKDDLRHVAAAWIEENPEVYGLFERFALQMAARSRRFGISLLTERVRWEVAFAYDEGEDGEKYKVNNNHRGLHRAAADRGPPGARAADPMSEDVLLRR